VVEPGVAILVSAFGGIVALVVNVRSNKKRDRRQHTYSVRQEYRNNPRYIEALGRGRELVKDARRSGTPIAMSTLQASDQRMLTTILDQHEFLSASIYNGDIDERFMRDCERSLLVETPKHFRLFIDEMREAGQPTAYQVLEALASRWSGRPSGPVQRTAEWWLMRPLRKPARRLVQIDARTTRAWRKCRVAGWTTRRRVRARLMPPKGDSSISN
jgi:hypothetical protein